MNAIEILSMPRIRRIDDSVDMHWLHLRMYGGRYTAGHRTTAGDITCGDRVAFGTIIPDVKAGQPLYCCVSVKPTATIHYASNKDPYNVPVRALEYAVGSMSLGVSALGGGSPTAEIAELKSLGIPGRTNQAHYIPNVNDASQLVTYTQNFYGWILEDAGFGIQGTSIMQEIPRHTEIARLLVACVFAGCFPSFDVAWYTIDEPYGGRKL